MNSIRITFGRVALATTLLGLGVAMLATSSPAQTAGAPAKGPSDADVLLDFFQKKGLISPQDVKDAHSALDSRTNQAATAAVSPWKFSSSFKSIQFFGDFRVRYEYRGMDNVPGAQLGAYYRERFRYALRFGLRGELLDDFNYGFRLETSSNPRSPWATFGNNTTAGSVSPSDKAQSGINIGQAYLGWHPDRWYEMTVGRMPMPLYTTPLVWDSDINPEGAFEKFKLSVGDTDLFVDFGQFDYQDPNPASFVPSSDTFILAFQVGANAKFGSNMFFKIAPAFYTYTGISSGGNGLNQPFVGQGSAGGANTGVPGAGAAILSPGATDLNQQGLNDLMVLEVPAEFDFKILHSPFGALQARLFGDFAYNFQGEQRALAAYNANPAAFPGLGGAVRGQTKAYQIGFGIGSDGPVYGPTQGLVYGSTSRKNTWEARAYWQRIEQYALDVNLIDSDFFEGRANLQGFYTSFAYSFTDAIIGTIRYGYATRINNSLGTGGNNLDIPGINPVKNYNLVQTDLTWRF